MANGEKSTIKMSGYLEKKSKMKVMSSWKNYWFVLEGRLLLYYRSKDTLSPCKGSINLGPRCAIKPAAGGTCMFQIETRSNTILLKAPNRLEQDKWLQAILTALNQSPSSSNGMVHFRYSSDDLIPTTVAENKKSFLFTRQNTMPERLKAEKKDNQQRIDRLQTIGAKTYGGSLETIQKLAKGKSPLVVRYRNFKKRKQSLSSHDISFVCGDETLRSHLNKRMTYPGEETRWSFVVDNDQYCTANEAKQSQDEDEVNVRLKLPHTENIYERVSGESQAESAIVDNEHYIVDSNIYARVSSDSDIVVENDQYSLAKSVMRETDTVNYHEYTVPNKQALENIYSVPQMDQQTDHNDNSVSPTKHQQPEVNPYSICQIYPKNATRLNEEKLYDTPDDYCEPVLPPRPVKSNETSRDCNNILSKLKKFGIGHEKGHSNKVAKKASFIRKLFKKKNRKHAEDDEEEQQYVTIDECVISKLEHNSEIDKQVLEELKKILVDKKESLKVQMKSEVNSEEEISDSNGGNEEGLPTNTATGDHLKPALPQKQKYSNDCSLFSKFRNRTRKSSQQDITVQPETLKTIDEILNDLDMEKLERDRKLVDVNAYKCDVDDEHGVKQNVKELIDKFNGVGKPMHETFLRQKSPAIQKEIVSDPETGRQDSIDANVYRHSDELNRLLNELIKVTTAPILTPGVTSSLGVTLMNDDELFTMAVNKRRRLSDPDYDVPRPHTNLNIIRSDEKTDGVLTATRFFGPALTSTGNKADCVTEGSMSITPDSLEIETTKPNREDDTISSYNSHSYMLEKASPLPVPFRPGAGVTYENFKHDTSYNNCAVDGISGPSHQLQFLRKQFFRETIDLEQCSPSDVFVDSLEPLSEISTVL